MDAASTNTIRGGQDSLDPSPDKSIMPGPFSVLNKKDKLLCARGIHVYNIQPTTTVLYYNSSGAYSYSKVVVVLCTVVGFVDGVTTISNCR